VLRVSLLRGSTNKQEYTLTPDPSTWTKKSHGCACHQKERARIFIILSFQNGIPLCNSLTSVQLSGTEFLNLSQEKHSLASSPFSLSLAGMIPSKIFLIEVG
jgi:hypothetical protein